MTVIKTASKPAAPPPIIPYRKMGEIDYDSLDFDPGKSVEKPDAMQQHDEQHEMIALLRAYFARHGKRADVFVDFDSNICYDPSNLRRHVSPDAYIAFGVDAKAIRERLIYLPWEVGKPPDFVLEMASRSTAKEDIDNKPRIYEQKVGAQEYWMHDPTGGRYYGRPLHGRKLVDGKYQDIELTEEPDGVLKGYSEVLGLSLAWRGGFLRLYNRESGEYLRNAEELEDALHAAEARANAEATARRLAEFRANRAEIRADSAEAQRDIIQSQLETTVEARAAAEEENRRLREIIRRLRNR